MRDTFSTDGQYNKYLKIHAFFTKLIDMKKKGFFFLVDNDVERNPYIDGYEMGFCNEAMTGRTVFLGATFAENPKTGEYDVPWVDVTLKELRCRIIPLQRAKL